MTKRTREQTRSSKQRPSRRRKAAQQAAQRQYGEASRLAAAGELTQARKSYEQLKADASDPKLRALVHNDLAVIAAAEGDPVGAVNGLRMALTLHSDCEPARLNLALLEVDALVEDRESRVDGRGPEKTEDVRPQNADEQVIPERCLVDRQQVQTPGGQTVSGAGRSTLNPQPFPKCLLLMVTYNRLEYTKLAIEAVLQLDYPALDVVVWDNASTNGTPEYLKERLRGLFNVRLDCRRKTWAWCIP